MIGKARVVSAGKTMKMSVDSDRRASFRRSQRAPGQGTGPQKGDRTPTRALERRTDRVGHGHSSFFSRRVSLDAGPVPSEAQPVTEFEGRYEYERNENQSKEGRQRHSSHDGNPQAAI